MKVNWNIKYTTVAVYSFIVAALSIIFYLIASEVNLFRVQVGKYLNTLQPFIIGFVMAYLFNFILIFYEGAILDKLFPKKINKKFKRLIGLVLTYATVGLLFYLF